jgi:hypothetical protein
VLDARTRRAIEVNRPYLNSHSQWQCRSLACYAKRINRTSETTANTIPITSK